MLYDYLVVGSGLFGATFSRLMKDAGRSILVIDKNNHIGGSCYTKTMNNVIVHLYGAHLFHTNSIEVWNFVNRFAVFNNYHHKVLANYNNSIISLPFNMTTYYQLWGCSTPEEARKELEKRKLPIQNPCNLEEWCLSQVGEEIYHKLIYHYTKKQWMRDPKDLPIFIIKRLPLRMTYDNQYFNDHYQGVPCEGYTPMFEKMLDGIEMRLNEDFFEGWSHWRKYARRLIYTGSLDRLFDYRWGELEYRTLQFEHHVHNGNFQGIGSINYTDDSVAYTRIHEHKHFYTNNIEETVITYEFPIEWSRGLPEYYPINDVKNMMIYEKYRQNLNNDIIAAGRAGGFVYLDMGDCVSTAFKCFNSECN